MSLNLEHNKHWYAIDSAVTKYLRGLKIFKLLTAQNTWKTLPLFHGGQSTTKTLVAPGLLEKYFTFALGIQVLEI